jgi:hypothetical protein
MKKLLLLIPVGLLATAGLVWTNYGYNVRQSTTISSTKAITQDPVQLFSLGERSVRQMIRCGDEKSISSFQSYSDALDAALIKYKKLGVETQNAQEMLSLYKQDSQHLTQTASLYSQKLHTYSNFEQNQEKAFRISLDQIGLHDLKTTFKNLDKAQVEYIKEPSSKNQTKYEELSKDMTQMINELYLDTAIEQPLITYIQNHAHYFQTVVSIYTAAGIESINRLHKNSYAIKAQLELLPKS